MADERPSLSLVLPGRFSSVCVCGGGSHVGVFTIFFVLCLCITCIKCIESPFVVIWSYINKVSVSTLAAATEGFSGSFSPAEK